MRIRLSTRLILLIVALQVLMLFLLVWNSNRLMTDSHIRMYEDMMRSESQLLAKALVPGMLYTQSADLQKIFDQLGAQHKMVYAVLSDANGEPLAISGKTPHRNHPDHDYQSALNDGVFDIVIPLFDEGRMLGKLRVGYSLDAALILNQKTRRQNLLIALLGVIITLSATFLLGFYFTRNLRQLEKGARELAKDHLDYRIETGGKASNNELATTFNHLAQHLSETKQALHKEHSALERETRFMQALLDGIDAVVMEARPPGYQFTFVSREASNLMGFPVSDWLKPDFWASHVHPDDRDWLEETIATHTKNGESFTADFRMIHHDGHELWVRAINSVELDEDQQPIMRGLILDITEQKTAEERIVYLAEHDSLTGLINRRRFQKELERAISFSQRYQQQGAVLFIDLDQFKYVNDTYGHQYGDEYLLDVSRRLSQVLRRTDILGRLGGDEFGVIIPKCSYEEAHTVGMALLGALAQENLEYGGKVIPVSASIGIALFPSQSAVPSDLLAKADAAMYTAKRKGRGQVHIFSDDDVELWNMQSKIHWEERIRWALKDDRFKLFYQPVVEVASGLITHYEVLLRMRGEDGEMIAPGAYMETAERFGLIREIDRWVVDKAIKAQADSIKKHKPVSLAINLSGRHFGNVGMLEYIKEAIHTYGADPQSLMFEVTETEAVENLSKARGFIDALRDIGCKFALDDFGIGFSSFHYLRNLPVDYIKIDGSFVRNLHIDNDDRLFVKAIVDLARGLKIPCIAEFVENAHIIEILMEMGVQLGQGYFIAKPEPECIDDLIVDMSQY
ncbi:MAG TPA: EAL domain-containing protein [Gammaproteobacteria bacterium]|nr:EAL domain-containing protein [Gammaproteobacteria bacterium]